MPYEFQTYGAQDSSDNFQKQEKKKKLTFKEVY